MDHMPSVTLLKALRSFSQDRMIEILGVNRIFYTVIWTKSINPVSFK